MADETNKDTVTKADLDALMTAFESKMEVAKAAFKTELDIQANKIHSSYAKKAKQITPEDEVDETVSNRKPTKREIEMQANLEKLVKKAEEAELKAKRASQRATKSDVILKAGLSPDSVDTILTILEAKGQFVEDETDPNGFKMKVKVDDADVALPMESAMKHWVKSADAKFFLAPKGAAGSGATTPAKPTTPPSDGKPKAMVEVDWNRIGEDLIHTSGG